jgi:hypothetical protein
MHDGVEAYLEAVLLPEDGAWRYVGTWTMLTAIQGPRMGCTVESYDDPLRAIGAAGSLARSMIDAVAAEQSEREDEAPG